MASRLNIILFGATGMVGEGVLHECLLDEGVASVLVIGRRSCEVQHPKLQEIVHDNFFDYSSLRDRLIGYDACLFCLGVSSIGMKEDAYRHLTYDLTVRTAEILVQMNPGMTFCYVSGAGTDSSEQGRSMWARVKGKTENDVAKLPFKAVYLFRPGFIKPTKGLKRAYTFAGVLGAMYPILKIPFRKYVCTLEELGLAMIRVSRYGYGKRILECVDISRVGRVTG